MPKKRANGEGTISYYEGKKLWEASITLSRHPGTGKLTRRTVYSKTQKEAQTKLSALKRAQEDGTLRSPDKTTVTDWSVDWLAHVEMTVKAVTPDHLTNFMRVRPRYGTRSSCEHRKCCRRR